ncbi:hypothetical protein [Streptomyces sp. AM6-12]|uniref:hypothetical protein n=1 Tax=Streptomyces sp. AM6-12 TaxID=3345149 RepID=UPI0037AFE4B4
MPRLRRLRPGHRPVRHLPIPSGRRAVVATAVALVGGGLTLAALDRHTADRAQAATPLDDGATGTAPQDEAPDQAPVPSAPPGTPPARHSTPATRTPDGTSPVRQAVTTRPPAPPPPPPAAPPPVDLAGTALRAGALHRLSTGTPYGVVT